MSDDEFPQEWTKCLICGDTPCIWMEYGSRVITDTPVHLEFHAGTAGLSRHFAPNEYRKAAYRVFTLLAYGPQGRGNRVKLPQCVVDRIREQWPDPRGQYMGHRNE